MKSVINVHRNLRVLVNHQLTHKEDRPFDCEMCKQCFKTKNALKKHKLIVHSEHKVFKCGECSKSFALKSQLQRHKNQVHTEKIKREKKQYKCDQCDFVTSAQSKASGLNIHRRSKHMERSTKGNPQKCHDCDFESETSWKMYQHKLKVHIPK